MIRTKEFSGEVAGTWQADDQRYTGIEPCPRASGAPCEAGNRYLKKARQSMVRRNSSSDAWAQMDVDCSVFSV